MIVLDTNVLSEPLKQHPDEGVIAWLSGIDEETCVTAISVGELLTGVRALPAGRRRTGLLDAIGRTLDGFAGAVLPYDADAAHRYAHLQEIRRSAGRPLSVEDGMIAAICAVRGTALATRDVGDFEGLGIELIDPWTVTTR
jgi:predicted nucleic acid-binding protein